MSSAPDDSRETSADALFADWLNRQGAGESPDIESLCGEHPSAALELRELHGCWSRIEALRGRLGSEGSLAVKLQSQFGAALDPQVTLEGEGLAESGFSSQALSRLAARGSIAARYRVKGEVARGGMGAVLRVWDEDLRRHLAMKVMLGKGSLPEQGDTPRVDPRLLARFLEEAQVTGQLEHPGIVPVHELGLDTEGRVYFTMKLVKGQTLREVFDELARGEGGWTQPRVLGLILKVCEAMSYAHSKGVIHRDLKPANVMIGKFGEVYVMDWGLAKVLGRADDKDVRVQPESALVTSEVRSMRQEHIGEEPDSPLYTMDGDVVGTPAYMSPEQAGGRVADMGPHSDVYAVGAMLYQLMAGHMPYVPPGVKANNYAVWQLVQRGPPEPLQARKGKSPAELIAICERAMARDGKARYADMTALAADLGAFVEGRVVRAYVTSFLRRVKAQWKHQSVLARAGIVCGYCIFPLLLLSAALLEKLDLSSNDLLKLIKPTIHLSSFLIFAGLLVPKKAKALPAIAWVPVLMFQLLAIPPIASVILGTLSPPASATVDPELVRARGRRKSLAEARSDGDPAQIVRAIRALSIEERSFEDHLLLAQSLRTLGSREEAVACLQLILERYDPDDPFGALRLTPSSELVDDDWDWFALIPSDEDIASMRSLLAVLLLELGESERARDALLQGLER